jgi:hypothetical protein
MESAEPSPPPAKLNSQLFELIKIVITLVLTGVIGGGITYWYQNRAQQKQQETKDLETARESVIAFLREFADILEHRKYLGFRCLHALRDKGPPNEVEELWKNYMEAVPAWNLKWNLYRALILEELGPDLQKRFYDEAADDKGDFGRCSITGKLIIFHSRLSALHKQSVAGTPPQDTKDIEIMYQSLAEDCYRFYSDVIYRIQEGKVGKRSWTGSRR